MDQLTELEVDLLLDHISPVQRNFFSTIQELEPVAKKNPPSRPLNVIIKVRPQAKKAKLDPKSSVKAPETETSSNVDKDKPPLYLMRAATNSSSTLTGLVSYDDDESDED